jgi:hypothetical protein
VNDTRDHEFSFVLAAYFTDPVFHRYFLNMLGFTTFKLPGVFVANPGPQVVPTENYIRSEDGARRELALWQAGRIVGSADGSANLCPETDAFGFIVIAGVISEDSTQGRRRRLRCNRGSPCGSSRSISPHARSATVTVGRADDLGCLWQQGA